jgi:hypothetical protein
MFCENKVMMLTIQITKRADGAGVLRCTRQDGSVTWQKQSDRHAAFYARHDVTHFAVESALGFRRGFYGLIAAGWEIEDTTGKGPRGALPSEAVEVEHIVGLFDGERASGTVWTAAEFNQSTATQAAASGRPAPRQFSEEELARVRAVRARLFSEWDALAPGGILELRHEF